MSQTLSRSTLARNITFAAGLLACGGLAELAPAQNALLFTGRFPFVSLDAVNERPNGSINELSRYAFSYCRPGAGAFARSLLPATGMQCYLGDGNGDNNYLKFDEFSSLSYFLNLQIGGIFVQHADRGDVTWDRVYFTVRDNVAEDIEVLTSGGTQTHTLVPGDWVRLMPNGDVEFFMTPAQLAVAAGAPPAGQGSTHGAHALVQTDTGDLYYSPVQGGHWVNGNQGGPIFANDGAIVKIAAADINYDSNGNISSFNPDSAVLCLEETNAGSSPNPRSIRMMVGSAGAFDNAGNAILGTSGSTVYAKTSGLGLDPNGGTFQTTFPDGSGAYTDEPNLVFTSDAGRYGGTIFSTASNGSIATINGQLCGSNLSGVPATGAWLGVTLDVSNFQPTIMGLTVVDDLDHDPVLLDQPNFGALDLAANQPTWDIDLNGPPAGVAFLIATFGPGGPGGVPASIPASLLPVTLGAGHADIFTSMNTLTLGLAVTDPNGYATFSFNNPNSGGFSNLRFVLQAAAGFNPDIRVSTPTITQLR
ncbi:MAG: hypothetical protein NXI31_26195 [bacterium]|nr:hypothetical protein [bacterium]